MQKLILNKKVLEGWREIDAQNWRKCAKELIHTFFENSLGQFGSLIEAWNKNDYKAVKSLAHSLKSSCGYVGAEKAYDILNEIDNEPIDSMVRLVETVSLLEKVFEQTTTELKELYKSDYAA